MCVCVCACARAIPSGVRIHNFHGNFLIRGQDLMAVPNIDSDKSFALEFTCANATVNAASVCVQCALLYTSFSGERRIRVHTLTVSSIWILECCKLRFLGRIGRLLLTRHLLSCKMNVHLVFVDVCIWVHVSDVSIMCMF